MSRRILESTETWTLGNKQITLRDVSVGRAMVQRRDAFERASIIWLHGRGRHQRVGGTGGRDYRTLAEEKMGRAQ